MAATDVVAAAAAVVAAAAAVAVVAAAAAVAVVAAAAAAVVAAAAAAVVAAAAAVAVPASHTSHRATDSDEPSMTSCDLYRKIRRPRRDGAGHTVASPVDVLPVP